MKANYFKGSLCERLAAHTVVQANGCWHWNGATNNKGYGQITVAGKRASTHRVAFEVSVRKLNDGEQVLHRCDNPLCINPAHLFVGTPAINSMDKIAKGRHAHGERIATAKLTAKQVLEIRRSRALQSQLAATYGVTQSAISRVRNGARWKATIALEAA